MHVVHLTHRNMNQWWLVEQQSADLLAITRIIGERE